MADTFKIPNGLTIWQLNAAKEQIGDKTITELIAAMQDGYTFTCVCCNGVGSKNIKRTPTAAADDVVTITCGVCTGIGKTAKQMEFKNNKYSVIPTVPTDNTPAT